MMKKRNWMAGVCGAAVMGLLIAGTGTASAGTIPTGFQVGGFDLSGMTREEADQTIEKSIGEMENQTISIRVEGHEVQTTAAELGFSWVNQNEIDEEVEKLSGGNLLRRYLNQKELEQSGVDLQIETSVDEAKVAEFVQTRCVEFTTAPQDAVITHENGVFQVSQSSAGQEVDIDATTKALNEALAGGLSEPVSVDATVKNAEPTRTTEALSTIQDALGTFSTGFNPGNVSRSKNLRNGAAKINGTVLMPGEEFSAYTWLTPFTVENGYASAGSYANGQVVDTVGGGACQICTTLYNAALLAEMDITQRQNHSMIVTYVPASQDSAIAGTYKDLKFKNPYDTPIYMEGAVNGGTISFTIYGKETRPANRTIKYVSETLSKKDPGEPITKVDASLKPGARVKEQSAHYGLQSRLWKYVYVDGVETEKTLLQTDTYMASKAIYRVGPAVAAAAPAVPAGPQPETPPTRTTEALSTIQDALGTFSTGFNPGNVSRSKNLRNGAAKINGTVLMPGEEFSAYTWLTPFTVENGYASAGSYANGQVVDTVGGGACQICTTLYNAALLAEMDITQRQNHSMIVTYVPASQDSAIAGTYKDLKFKNPYDTPIYMEGAVNGGTISFTIYGKETRPANRTIKYVSETLSKKDPGEPITKVDASLKPGARVKEQSAHYGLQSRLWKYVYVDGVETEKTLLQTDTYMASKAIYRVGPAVAAAAPAVPAGPQPETPQPETPQPETPQPENPVPAPTEAPAAQEPTPAQPQGPAGPAQEAAPPME